MMALIFSAAYVPLLQLSLREGTIERVMLTPEGEEMLEGLIDIWMTKGISAHIHPGEDMEDGSRVYHSVKRQVLMSDEKAERQVRMWTAEKGMIFFAFSEPLLSDWESLRGLSLTPEERFVSFEAMVNASPERLQAWRTSIAQMLKDGTFKVDR